MLSQGPRSLLVFLSALFSLLPLSNSFAQEEIGEEALFRFEEYVVTAARKVQRIEEAPAAVTVITAEDIRQSGLDSIPEILRQVAGLDVLTLSAFDSQVNIRGFARPTSNKLLVLIDGRSVYEDFIGSTIWETIPIQLEDIKRIEVVKGPGSVMYGANAFSGVVNIITKSPEESKGGLISVTDGWFKGSGQTNQNIRSLIYGGKIKNIGYKVTGGWEQATRFAEHDETSEKAARGSGQLSYRIADNSAASLEAGIIDGEGELFVVLPGKITEFREGHVKANYDYSGFKAQTFFKDGRFEMPLSVFGIDHEKYEEIEEMADIWGRHYTYDLELQQSIELARIHTIMGGFNYRFFTLKSNYTKEEGLNTYAGFLQYEIRPIRSIIFNLGVRVDHEDYIGTNYSPRGSLIVTPVRDHTLRFSVGQAFRNPNYIDLFVDLSIDYMGIPDVIRVMGNEELDPESITSYDLGYQATLFDRLRAKLDLFFFRIEDRFDTFQDQELDLADLKFIITTSNNAGVAKGIGGEAGLDYQITPWLSGLINYSYQKITDEEDKLIKSNPKNKVNGGLRFRFSNGLGANILLHYVGVTKRNYLVTFFPEIVQEEAKLDPYLLLNASLSYRIFDDRLAFAVGGQNLLDYKNYKDKLYNDPGANHIPIRVFGRLRVKF